jgi:hypothetical protein
MKSCIVIGILISSIMMFATSVNAQAIISTSAGVNIVDNGLSISQNRPIGFDELPVPSTPVEIIINNNIENALPDGDNAGNGKEISMGNSACFTVKGKPGAVYAISIPSDITITHSNGLDQIAVAAFSASSSSQGNGHEGKVNADGIDQFSVGATLKLGSGQRSGYYSGIFGISVNYN